MDSSTVIIVEVPTVIVSNQPATRLVSAASQGPPGTAGIAGPAGPTGPKGDPNLTGTADWNTLDNKPVQFSRQDFLNTNVISFTHNMQTYPAVHVEDTSGNRWIPKSTHYPTLNDIVVTFDTVFSGTVFLG